MPATDNSQTKIGLIKPADMLGMLTENAVLAAFAGEPEAATIRMVDEAC